LQNGTLVHKARYEDRKVPQGQDLRAGWIGAGEINIQPQPYRRATLERIVPARIIQSVSDNGARPFIQVSSSRNPPWPV